MQIMQIKISTGLGIVAATVAGSLLLPSCSKSQPAPATTVIVQAPAAPVAPASNNDAKQDEIADLRTSEDIGAKKSANKSDAEPTDRDVEDAAPAKRTSSSKSKSKLMDFYDRLPAKHFAAFGGVNRRSLLKRKGAIVDYKHNFIEIPGSDSARDGDLRALQMTLFPNGSEPWCAVSRIVWPQHNTPAALDFYYDSSDSGALRVAAEGFFPYPLQKSDMGYRSAWLPRRGLDIIVSTVNDTMSGDIYHYNRDFSVGQAAFYPIDNYEAR